MSHPRWATKRQAADHLGVSVRTIDRFITDKRLTAYRLGHKITRVDLNEVDALVTAATQ